MDSNDIRVPVRYLNLRAGATDDDFDPDDGPWRFSGIAVAPGDILHMEDGTPVLITEEELRKAAPSQAGEPVTADHPMDEETGRPQYPPSTDDTFGKIPKADYLDDRGVGYEMVVHDEDLARGLYAGSYEVSVHPRFSADEVDPDTGALIAEDIEFLDLSVVSKGDSPSNTVNWGPSRELAAWVHDHDIASELTAAIKRPRTPEYDGTETSPEWGDVEKTFEAYLDAYYDHTDAEQPDDPPSTVADASQELRQWIAERTLLGNPDAGTTDELIVLPVVNPSTNNLSAPGLVSAAQLGGQLEGVSESAATSAQNKTRRLLNEEFDRDIDLEAGAAKQLLQKAAGLVGLDLDRFTVQAHDEPAESGATSTTEMDDIIDTLVNDHDFSEESLEAMEDDDLERLHETVVDDDGGDGQEQQQNQGTDNGDNDDNVVEVDLGDHDSLDDYISSEVEQQVEASHQQLETKEKVEEIIAHSDDFDEDDREDLMASSETVLDRLHEQATATTAAQLPGSTGRGAALASAGGANEDADQYQDVVAELNGRGSEGGD